MDTIYANNDNRKYCTENNITTNFASKGSKPKDEPVNWHTDAIPAILNDTITVTLDPATNVLVVKGFDGSYLPNILDILNVGDYHGAEPWLYSEYLRQNFRQRIEAFKWGQMSRTE